MNMGHKLPGELREMLASFVPRKNETGCSSASVFCYENAREKLFLKIQKTDEDIRAEHAILHWVADRLPVPAVRFYREEEGFSYLLTTAMSGHMSFLDAKGGMFREHEKAVTALSAGLLTLQALDIRDCPFVITGSLSSWKRRATVWSGAWSVWRILKRTVPFPLEKPCMNTS